MGFQLTGTLIGRYKNGDVPADVGFVFSLEGNGDISFQYDTGTGNNINVKRLVTIQYPSTTFGSVS